MSDQRFPTDVTAPIPSQWSGTSGRPQPGQAAPPYQPTVEEQLSIATAYARGKAEGRQEVLAKIRTMGAYKQLDSPLRFRCMFCGVIEEPFDSGATFGHAVDCIWAEAHAVPPTEEPR